MRTDELIDRLAEAAVPAAPLAAPARRAALWFLAALPFVAAVVLAHGSLPGIERLGSEPRFLVEQLAAFATAILAAIGAFASTVPGASRRWLWLPLVPLAVWLASVGRGCLDDWIRLGPDGLRVVVDTGCWLPMAMVGFVPAVLMVVMLRRGAPLRPHLSLALGGLAVAAVANAGLQLFHLADVSIMVLVWHLGTVAVFSAVASLAGPRLLPWRVGAAA